MFLISILGGVMGYVLVELLVIGVKLALNKQHPGPIIDTKNGLRSMMSVQKAKRKPKVLTDEMAYLKEIQDEGANRG